MGWSMLPGMSVNSACGTGPPNHRMTAAAQMLLAVCVSMQGMCGHEFGNQC